MYGSNDDLQLEDVTEKHHKAIFIGEKGLALADLIIQLVNVDYTVAANRDSAIDELWEIRDKAQELYPDLDLILIDQYRLF